MRFADAIRRVTGKLEKLGFTRPTPSHQGLDDSSESSSDEESERCRDPVSGFGWALQDQPTKNDDLGFRPYVSVVEDFLTHPDTELPITISVEGAWGKGKSSFIKQLQDSLTEREVRTFRFNPWRHEEKDELWAAFAKEFLRDIRATQPLHQRLLGDIKLLRRRYIWYANSVEIVKTVVFGLGILLAAAVSLALIFIPSVLPIIEFPLTIQMSPLFRTLIGGSGLLAVIAATLTITGRVQSRLVTPLDPTFHEYATNPNYEDRVSFLSEFHEDFNRIISAYIDDERVIVFIDDLDRCGIPKGSELIQSINLLLAQSDPQIGFVIALDREKIAAGIAARYEKLLPYLVQDNLPIDTTIEDEMDSQDAQQGVEFGHRYLEKFIEIPFRVPDPQTTDIQNLITESSSKIQLGDSNGAISQDLLDRHSERLSEIVEMVAPVLNHNPRKVIRFMNLYRLRALLAFRLGLLYVEGDGYGNESFSLPQLAKFVVITLEWPQLVTQLSKSPETLHQLEQQALTGDIELPPAVEHWGQDDLLMELLAYGIDSDNEPKSSYSFQGANIERLLQVSPRTDHPTETEEERSEETARAEAERQRDIINRLEEQGFRMLQTQDFTRREVDREFSWRRPFTFSEVNQGLPIERQRSGDTRTNLTEGILATLEDGGAGALIGPPGSGKSTSCRMVANQWHQEERGPIIYRASGVDPIRDPDAVVEALRELTSEGSVLVFAEDAAREDAIGLFEVIHELEPNSLVSFLLNSREREWDQFRNQISSYEGFDTTSEYGQEVLATRRRYIETISIPRLDEFEISRILNRFEEITGKTIQQTPEELFEQLQSDHDVSRMLMLSYYLPIGTVDPSAPDERGSALEVNVSEVYNQITNREVQKQGINLETDPDLAEDVVLLINTLNAADISVYPEYLYTLGTSKEEFQSIDQIINAIDGLVHFGQSSDGEFWVHHETWSELYLQLHLERSDSENIARSEFEEMLNSFFGIFDSQDRRDKIRDYIGHDTQRFDDDIGSEEVDEVVTSIFSIGENRPSLVPLFGSSEYSGLELPEAISTIARARTRLSRSRMFRGVGAYDRARAELEEFHTNTDDATMDAKYFNALGSISHSQGHYDQAITYLQQSLDSAQEAQDKQQEATSLVNLGIVARSQGDYEQAREYFEESLEISRELGDRQGKASSLENLGIIVRETGDLEGARENFEESLEISRDLGDRQREASSLENLAVIAQERGDYQEARDYHIASLEIRRELGNRQGEASSLENLGIVARSRGDYDQAREYFEQSLELRRNIGDRGGEVSTLKNLGTVAREIGDLERAREYFEQSLEISRELGDRQGEASIFYNLGVVLGEEGNHKQGAEYFEEAAGVFEEMGAIRRLLNTYKNLIRAYRNQGNTEVGINTCEKAITIIQESNISGLQDELLSFLTLRAQLDKSKSSTRDLYRLGLVHILKGNVSDVAESYNELWDRKEQFEQDSDIFSIVLRGGVCLAAHIKLVDKSIRDRSDILEAISLHQDGLTVPTDAVYTYLTESEVDLTPTEIRERAEVDEDVDPVNLKIGELEAYACSKLLDSLISANVGSEEPS